MVDHGESAIERAVELKPDVIILDFYLPCRDGVSVARAIHGFLPDVPVIFYSVQASRYIQNEAKTAGTHAIVQKPDSIGLVAAIRRAVAVKPS